ncbi:MAG TPA: hypothetical protein VGF76_06430 [Polyangiaceae bacterium]|jgi:hypothetical protein
MDESLEPLSDHPLFRALVLMGGGLALSCGGIAEGGRASTGDGAAGAASSAAGASSSSGSSGATTILVAVPSSAGATSLAGVPSFAGAPNVTPPTPDCPYAQWDCTSDQPICYLPIVSATDPAASNCFCNTNRPLTPNDCKPSESLVCLQGSNQALLASGQAGWDGSVHLQCSCVEASATGDTCDYACAKAFPDGATLGQGGELFLTCMPPPKQTCADNGVCTATSADVLRQDGIMCGCADVGLK